MTTEAMPGRPQRARAHRIAALALGVACLAAALATAGCGASSVIDPVAQAAGTSTRTPGYRMTFDLRITSGALPSGITATGTGTVNVRSHTGAVHLGMQLPDLPQIRRQLGGTTLAMDEVMDGTVFYMRLPEAIMRHLPGGRPWIKLDIARAAAGMGMPGLSSMMSSPLSSDPSQLLQYLRGVSGGVTKVGTATVAGYPTTEYRATVDLNKVADKVPTKNRAAVQASIQQLEALTHLKQIPVDVWIDNSSLVRRFALQMQMSLPTGQSMAMSMRLTIPEYGPQPRPAIPPAGQVTDLGALMHSGAAGSGSASATS